MLKFIEFYTTDGSEIINVSDIRRIKVVKYDNDYKVQITFKNDNSSIRSKAMSEEDAMDYKNKLWINLVKHDLTI